MPLDPNCFEKVVLFLSARELLKIGSFSGRTDPFLVLYEVDSRKNSQLVLLGITDVTQDNSNPDWSTPFTIDYQFECIQELVCRVYHSDGSHATTDVQRHTFLGESRFLLSKLMCAAGQKLIIANSPAKSGIAQGFVSVRGESLTNTRDRLCVTFSGNNLVNKGGFFGTSDPFLSISRTNEDNTRTVVFQNKRIDNTLNPRWAEVRIPTATLCNGDFDRPLRIEVWDWDKHGKHVSMGVADTSVRSLLGTNGSSGMHVIEADKKAKSKSYVNSGSLVASNVSIEKNPTFSDFITGGCEISLVVAIDFTMSNGDPVMPQSLHYINPTGNSLNAYQHAIQSVCSVLQPYDSDHMYPVYGFGARVRLPDGQYSPAQHCFPVYGGGVEVPGLDGILTAYKDCLRSVMLSGPTLFGPLITAAAHTAASANCCQEKQKYTILLILTDGVVNDLEQTVAAVVAASFTPLSIVIVGVGNADFAEMHALDSDEKMLSHSGTVAARDIVQFVSFNEMVAKGSHALAEHVLQEIPTQLLAYMKQHAIVPHEPK